MPRNNATFTVYGWAVCFWALINAFQYGYHISVLNQIHAVLTCKDNTPDVTGIELPTFTTCIPMSQFAFSFVTAVFTIGGLIGSLVATWVMDNTGRRGTHRLCAVLIIIGNAFMGLGTSLFPLLLGRFIIGVASGLSLCVGPIYLAEIAPSSISGSVAVLLQLSIVLGIMFTQLFGLNLATPSLWRYVFLISFGLSGFQLLTSSAIVESPVFLSRCKLHEQQKRSAKRLWRSAISSTPLEEPLLGETQDPHADDTRHEALSIPQVFKSPDFRKPLLIVCLAMLSQQISGINAVLYYSNSILSHTLPNLGPYVSLSITIVNTIMTFPPIFLIERLGRRPLLQISVLGSIISLITLGIGLDSGASKMASVSIAVFVMSFAVGLGPVPFVMIPEVSPPQAVSAISSIALSLNWITNFLVGLAFLPIQSVMSGGDRYKEGRIFFLFAALFGWSTFSLFRLYRG